MAEQVHPLQTRRIRPETSAWLTLFIFFGIFCGIVAALGYAGWHYYSTAMTPAGGALLRVYPNPGVFFQARGTNIANLLQRLPPDQDPCPGSPDVCTHLEEGDRVIAVPGAGYGPVASVVLLDQTQIQLWAHPTGADLTLESYRVSRWRARRQEVVLRQPAGYARYDVTRGQPYGEVAYTVVVTDGVRVLLSPGGSYSIDAPRDETGAPRPLLVTDAPALVEVAVRAGSATIVSGGQRAIIRPKEKVRVGLDGQIGEPADAAWELIADGDFSRHSEAEYNQGTDTWSVIKGPLAQNMAAAELNGVFRVPQPTCPPNQPDVCNPEDQVRIAQFRREGGQKNPYSVGITQTLNVDVSEYTQSLRFHAWTRILTQTVESTGVSGSECPIMIIITYKQTSPTDEQLEDKTCVYSGPEAQVRAPEIRYRRIPLGMWYDLGIELRGDQKSALKPARYLRYIRIEARGHDYVSQIYGISLIGK